MLIRIYKIILSGYGSDAHKKLCNGQSPDSYYRQAPVAKKEFKFGVDQNKDAGGSFLESGSTTPTSRWSGSGDNSGRPRTRN